MSGSGNGHDLPGPCAVHDAAIAQHSEDISQHADRLRALESQDIAEQERWKSVSRQASSAAVDARAAADQSKAAVNATVALSTDVRNLRDAVDSGFNAIAVSVSDLAGRLRDLERPTRPPMPSDLDYLSEDTKANAVDPNSLAILRELNTARERAAAAEAALATREKYSDHQALRAKERRTWLFDVIKVVISAGGGAVLIKLLEMVSR